MALDIGGLQTGGRDVGALQGTAASGQTVSGTTGGLILVRGGANPVIGNPVAGQVGGLIVIRGDSGARILGGAIAGTTGGRIVILAGTGGAVGTRIVGGAGGRIRVRGGVTGAVLLASARNLTVFYNGADISRYVLAPVRRSMQTSGGSKAACELRLTNRYGLLRPACGGEIIVYEGKDRFFAGVVDTTEEFSFSGTSGLIEITCRCVDYGALLDRLIIGRKYEISEGAIANVLLGHVWEDYLQGILTGVAAPSTWVGVQTFNWLTATEVFNQVAAAANLEWYVDFNRIARFVARGTGWAAAPFTITDNDGNWAEMRVTRSQARRRNRQGVRNSKDLKVLWTDTFHGDGITRVWVPMAELSAKPIIRVNGVDQVVTDLGTWNLAWDFYWLSRSVVQNTAHAALTPSDTLEVKYPSPLSYVAWSEDAADIAAHGLWEAIEEVKDVDTLDALQTIAAALLARGKTEPVTISFRTDKKGLVPGMLLTVNTTLPLCNSTLLVQQVESEEQGRKFFRHTVTASDAPLKTDISVWQKLIGKGTQAKDRVTEVIRFTLAETVEGAANPGLTVGAKQAVYVASKSGVARDCTLYFKTGGMTTAEVRIDLLKNGVSVFGTTKMVWPIGGGAVQTQYAFASDPLIVSKGDVFTLEVLAADAAAKDGVMELSVVG